MSKSISSEMKDYDPKRYTTKCSDCGDTLKGFDSSDVKTCRCGKVSAHDGQVSVEGRVVSKQVKQGTLFGTHTDYPE